MWVLFCSCVLALLLNQVTCSIRFGLILAYVRLLQRRFPSRSALRDIFMTFGPCFQMADRNRAPSCPPQHEGRLSFHVCIPNEESLRVLERLVMVSPEQRRSCKLRHLPKLETCAQASPRGQLSHSLLWRLLAFLVKLMSYISLVTIIVVREV